MTSWNNTTSVCRKKQSYDTAFEAEVAAAKTSALLEKPMDMYKCNSCRHYHLTSRRKTQRQYGQRNQENSSDKRRFS